MAQTCNCAVAHKITQDRLEQVKKVSTYNQCCIAAAYQLASSATSEATDLYLVYMCIPLQANQLTEKIRTLGGLFIKHRSYRFRTYKTCFIGKLSLFSSVKNVIINIYCLCQQATLYITVPPLNSQRRPCMQANRGNFNCVCLFIVVVDNIKASCMCTCAYVYDCTFWVLLFAQHQVLSCTHTLLVHTHYLYNAIHTIL